MQSSSLWQAVLGEIEVSVSRGNFMTWFRNTQLLEHSDDKAVVGVGNIFIKNQLETKFKQLVLDTLAKNGAEPKAIEFKIMPAGSLPKRPAAAKPAPAQTAALATPAPTATAEPAPQLIPAGARRASSTLTMQYRPGMNERYTFESFVPGSGNEMAYAACQAVAATPGTKYNPLFLYGGVGIGKTHLMQAVGNEVLQKKPDARIVYATTEQFVQEFVDALRFKKTTDFAKHYRSADVLIVDDIQFIAGKEKIQEEFFHTFNTLHQSNRQIIISSDRPPRDIPTLEERLQSRFAWGMSIDMQIPDFETRCAIIQNKATSHDMPLPPDVVEYLANLVRTNIRELEGALNQLIAKCELHNLEPELKVAQDLLGNVGKSRPRHLSAKIVIERTARHFSVTLDDIMGPKRDKDIVVPRQIAMYMLRSELHLSFPKIAHELGRKDHTTAIHSVEKIEKESRFDNDIRDAINNIRERLYA